MTDSSLYTADLCDANGDAVHLIAPLFRDFGGVTAFSGTIATVHCADDNSKVREQVERPGNGQVLVVDGGASMRCALLGGNLAALAQQNGWSGVLINGCVRDSYELVQIPLGVRALAACPRRSSKRQSGSVNIPLQFAGALFIPGHFLYADNDGMVLSAAALC